MDLSAAGFDGKDRELVLGRKTYEIFEAYWPYQPEDDPIARTLNAAKKTPFHEFQRSLAASALQFEPTPFAYKPHCTIVRLCADDAAAQTELARFSVPRHGVNISSVSLYPVNFAKNACHFIKHFPLGA
jgi:2'-5' RNA ligase